MIRRLQQPCPNQPLPPGRGLNSENVTPEQSLLPAPELTSEPVIVEEEQGAAGNQQKSNMVSLADFDLIKVIGRGSYAKVGL